MDIEEEYYLPPETIEKARENLKTCTWPKYWTIKINESTEMQDAAERLGRKAAEFLLKDIAGD